MTDKYSLTRIRRYKYDFIKTFLHAVYNKILNYKELTITHFAGLESYGNYGFSNIVITSESDTGLAKIRNDCVYVFADYKGNKYHISVNLTFESDGHQRINFEYWLRVLGSDADSIRADELSEFIISESFKHCPLRNKLLKIYFGETGDYIIDEIKIESIKPENLDDLFISEPLKFELERFYGAVKNFGLTKQRLRFLLSGEPGTGKTKAISALMHRCYGKATIIIAEGAISFNELFEIANDFSPSIICLDDVDLYVSNREDKLNNKYFSEFLNALDGMMKNDVFILATTNDKTLVDNAAKRPGRFDMILDFTKLDSKSYINLIRTNCVNENIINLFDSDIITVLKSKKVTGAYIVNLLKQLELQYKLDKQTNLKEYLNNLVDLTYQGFYKKVEEKQYEFGFNGS